MRRDPQGRSARRALITVAALAFVHVDIDFRSVAMSPDEVDDVLHGLPLRPRNPRQRGRPARHLALEGAGTRRQPEFHRVNELRTRTLAALGGDPTPNHAAALLRELGTLNRKHGEPAPAVSAGRPGR